MSKNAIYQVQIEKLITGGLGLAHLPDGLVAMVAGVLPCEVVRLEVTRRHKGYADATLLEVVEEAPGRVAPRCPAYGRCGGCQLQHVEPALQAGIKDGILRDLVKRSLAKREPVKDEVWQPPQPAPTPFAYRQRIRLQVDAKGRIGFYRPHSHTVEAVGQCPLARAELNAVLAQLADNRAMRALLPFTEAVELILSPDDRLVYLFLHYTRKPRPTDRQRAAAAAGELVGLHGLALVIPGQAMVGPFAGPVPTPTGGQESSQPLAVRYTLPADLCGRELQLSLEAGGFCQVNQTQNEHLVRTMLAWSALQPQERVLDLYCGMGNFSIPTAVVAKEVVGMDLQRSSIRSAQKNAVSAGLPNCHFRQNTALNGARELVAKGEKFDCILLDPPRLGCREVVPFLAELGARRLITISCDPATLARDLEALAAVGYGLAKIQMVDMFPQTHHLETIALLIRS